MFSTAALIIALSIFNGLEDLTKSLINSMKPDIKIIPIKRKFFSDKKPFIKKIYAIDEIFKIVKSIEENVLLTHEGNKIIAKIKGVSNNFLKKNKLKKNIVAGDFKLFQNKVPLAIIGRGIQYTLRINIYDTFSPIYVLYPKKIPTGVLGAANMFNRKKIYPSSVFSLEKEIDFKYIIVPISFVRKLLNRENQITSLDIYSKDNKGIKKTLKKIKKIIPENYKALDLDEQSEGFISAMKIEKRALTIICLTIIAVALINMFFVLSMLIISKRRDIAVLLALGATRKQIKQIFLLEGVSIASLGILFGVFIAIILIYIQKKFGIISLGVESSIIKYYPVKIKLIDIFYSIISVFIASIIASYKPAKKASETVISKENLE